MIGNADKRVRPDDMTTLRETEKYNETMADVKDISINKLKTFVKKEIWVFESEVTGARTFEFLT